ncbi:isocitrate lyase/phosphoenolpyruvate mutase family protein [Kibdelosporangium phytohabitans]|uniref:HpcH/HpaI aldolase/citrate lyase domain-containing protein n=1 Tax=Kibdelosporangium phytohabitans TaxID=860235 RepID=A0A0N9IBE8_9PSEU|nr:hypothetical protein AOZ06_37375 [Kibdelosporangium phytohabitans]MBE1463205.1 hypothetical protein [Kibdelosporangium phytohabitans]
MTAGAEGGYGLPETELAARLAEVGAASCAIEDTDHGGARQADRLAALRAASPELVINARVDVFLSAPDQSAVLDDGLERARAYLAAGAGQGVVGRGTQARRPGSPDREARAGRSRTERHLVSGTYLYRTRT